MQQGKNLLWKSFFRMYGTMFCARVHRGLIRGDVRNNLTRNP